MSGSDLPILILTVDRQGFREASAIYTHTPSVGCRDVNGPPLASSPVSSPSSARRGRRPARGARCPKHVSTHRVRQSRG
jgi:hypothetical protein